MNFLVDPRRPADELPAIWRAEDNPSVVIIAIPDQVVSPISDVIEGSTKLADQETRAGRHLVLATMSGRHRLLVTRSATVPTYLLPADAEATIRLATTSAFHASTVSYPPSLRKPPISPSPYQRHRLALLLAILDRCDDHGRETPTLRDLAQDVIFPGLDVGTAIDWKTSSHRRQVQRLVCEARRMVLAGFRGLLRHGAHQVPITPSDNHRP